MTKGKFKSYWSETGTYEAIVPLINMNFDGLRTAIIEMLSGTSVELDIYSFQNDTVSFANKDDVLTYLVHLGYLGYDQDTQRAFIPNEEIRQELTAATRRKNGMKYYFKPIREFPTGRGFADFVYIPKPEYAGEYPAILAELKWNRKADTAIAQIKEKSIRNHCCSIQVTFC